MPSDGDTGETFWDNLGAYGTRINTHDHDGVNSEPISSGSLVFTGMHLQIDYTFSSETTHDFDITAFTDCDARTAVVELIDKADWATITDAVDIVRPDVDTIRVNTTATISLATRLLVRCE